MADESRALKRSELYTLVWQKAVQRVAADIGISDVALAKACRKQHIPLPERGYWRRKEWGYKVRQPPLLSLPGGGDPIVAFHATPHAKDAPEPEILSPEEQFERLPENSVVVPESLDQLARPVRHTRAALRQRKPGDYGLVDTSAKDCFRVQIAPASLERAMRILQALADAFAARGHEVVEGDDQRSGLRVRVNGEVLTLSLTERVRKVSHVLTEREEIRQELNLGWKAP